MGVCALVKVGFEHLTQAMVPGIGVVAVVSYHPLTALGWNRLGAVPRYMVAGPCYHPGQNLDLWYLAMKGLHNCDHLSDAWSQMVGRVRHLCVVYLCHEVDDC